MKSSLKYKFWRGMRREPWNEKRTRDESIRRYVFQVWEGRGEKRGWEQFLVLGGVLPSFHYGTTTCVHPETFLPSKQVFVVTGLCSYSSQS